MPKPMTPLPLELEDFRKNTLSVCKSIFSLEIIDPLNFDLISALNLRIKNEPNFTLFEALKFLRKNTKSEI